MIQQTFPQTRIWPHRSRNRLHKGRCTLQSMIRWMTSRWATLHSSYKQCWRTLNWTVSAMRQLDPLDSVQHTFLACTELALVTCSASSKLTALRKNQALRLEAMQRHWTTAVNSLDPRIRSLSLDRFYSEFNGDKEAALRAVMTTQLRREQGPMSQVEQSARKR